MKSTTKVIKNLIKRIIFGQPAKGVPIDTHCRVAYTICPKEYLEAFPDNELNSFVDNIQIID